ncbi:hypothetical protein Pka01_03940 [Planotetraspora kaengkrachanensis]|uniref:Uncharacterized protein n=1 Tax=Planotetraspora kaengkrachanensis TaxID=575193 RepID=A0A8J3PPP3_9ACTN|nr:hypothetical protein Pka01_03940 [Planotetraspora kaengkrachanensis]
MALADELVDSRRRQRDPVLVGLDLAGNSDLHPFTLVVRKRLRQAATRKHLADIHDKLSIVPAIYLGMIRRLPGIGIPG